MLPDVHRFSYLPDSLVLVVPLPPCLRLRPISQVLVQGIYNFCDRGYNIASYVADVFCSCAH